MIDTGDFTMYCHWNKRLVCKKGFYCDACKHQPAADDKEQAAKPSLCSCGGLRIMTAAEFPNAPPVGRCRIVWNGASSAGRSSCPMHSQRN